MGNVDPPRSTAARVVARTSVTVVVLVVVAATSAFWNPWGLVVVERALFVPAVVLVTVFVFGCAFAALPVPAGSTRPFTPGRRALAAVGVPVLSLQLWASAGPGWPTEPPRELTRSPDGRHAVVLHRTAFGTQCLSVWTGRGAGARITGALGNPGDGPVVTFDGPDLITVRAERTVTLRLDPATGRPLDTLDRSC